MQTHGVSDADVTKRQLGWYLRNGAESAFAEDIKHFVATAMGIPPGNTQPEDDDEDIYGLLNLNVHQPRPPNGKPIDLTQLQRVLRTFVAAPKSAESLEQNVAFATEEFELDALDQEILLLVLRYERIARLETLADGMVRKLRSVSRAVACLVGADHRHVLSRLSPGGALVDLGLMTMNDEGNAFSGLGGLLHIAQPLKNIMHRSYRSREEWVNAILGPPLSPTLQWDDYAHLASYRELAVDIASGAVAGRAVGVNLLLHGPVGTGKTEFAKTFASRAGCVLWSVGEADDAGSEPSRGERLAALRLAQRLLSRRDRAMILFDEAEDLLVAQSPFGHDTDRSKVFINRLLERNRVPIIWTCNDAWDMDPAVLRRMSIAIEIKVPTSPVRERIWRRIADAEGIALTDDNLRRLVARFEVPPAVAANTAKVVRLAKGGVEELEKAVTGILRVLGRGVLPPNGVQGVFHPELTNCAEDVGVLCDRLCSEGAPRTWSLCLHGPPGTGKSQFTRYLARRLGIEIIQKRASDLLSKWVGDIEKRIAGAFMQARDEGAMLVFDEADSLLQDRREAHHGWEITQVNEMLTWMENHPLRFVCTTNLMERLDPACLRRFALKLRFDPLTPAQAALAFLRFFGTEAPDALMAGLTPGDFATVRKKHAILGGDARTLTEWLMEELESKGGRRRMIGFATS
jgi:transitional endoplasmic reticulum ATPase